MTLEAQERPINPPTRIRERKLLDFLKTSGMSKAI